MKPNSVRPGLSLVVICLLIVPVHADVMVLQDGTTLLCELLGERESNGQTFYEIDINGSRLMLNSSLVRRHDRVAVSTAEVSEREILVDLVREGKLLPSLHNQLGLQNGNRPSRVSSDLVVGEIRGWAYLMEEQDSGPALGLPLSVGDRIPDDQLLLVMANSRLRLDLGEAACMYFPPGAEIRMTQSSFDADVFTYRLSFDLQRRFTVLEVRRLPPPRKLKVSTGGIYFFARRGTVAVQGGPDDSVSLMPVDEPLTLSTALGVAGGHQRVEPGQSYIAQGGGVGELRDIDPGPLREFVSGWEGWRPEEADLDWRIPLPALTVEDAWPAEPMLLPAQITIIPELAIPLPKETMGETMQAWRDGLNAYREDIGRYPSQLEALEALGTSPGDPKWAGPYVDASLSPRDIWGQPFVYELIRDGETAYPDVRSTGPDGRDDRGLNDDLR